VSNVLPENLPSNRSFGFLFAVVFSALAVFSFTKSNMIVFYLLLFLSVVFIVIALATPSTLTPLNRLWYRFGRILGKVTGPIVLGVLFYLLVVPVAVTTRRFGRDELRLKKTNVETYWIDRVPPGPKADSFRHQF
jgi:hypothetical protein